MTVTQQRVDMKKEIGDLEGCSCAFPSVCYRKKVNPYISRVICKTNMDFQSSSVLLHCFDSIGLIWSFLSIEST